MGSENGIYTLQGFGGTVGLGRSPALLIVDFVRGFADPAQFGGGNILEAIGNTVGLLKTARRQRCPVVFSRVVYADDGSDGNGFTRKVPSLLALTESSPSSQIVDALRPQAGEHIVCKRLPSAFADTGLGGWLAMRGVDSVIVAGATTSGCVRASVTDAMGAGMRVVVATDCVGDRAIGPHEANLFDMGQKYADLMTSAEIEAALDGPSSPRPVSC